MPSYPRVTIGQVCSIVGGGTPSRKRPEFFEGSIPWATVKDFKSSVISTTEEHISEAAVNESATNLVPRGTVLLVSRVGLGKVAIAGERLAINQDIKALTPRDDVLPEYLYWFLLSKADHFVRIGVGATVKGITLEDIKSVSMPLPPIAEQRRIVDLLSRAESIVRLRREGQQKAAELVPAIFHEMFGDPGENPRGFRIVPLAEVSEVISGVAKGRSLEPGESVEVPYMRVANVKDGYLDLSEVKTIAIKRSEMNKLRIEVGDLLMTEGGDPDKLGRAALWNGEVDDCVHQNHVFKVRSDRSQIVPEYLKALAGSPYGKAYFLSVAKKTTGIASINKTQLSAFPVVVPPMPEQQRFARFVADAASIEAQQQLAGSKATATFQALLAHSFSGRA